MKPVTPGFSATGWKNGNEPMPANGNSSAKKMKFLSHDIVLNVDFKEALIRFGLTLLLPILALVINKRWVIYTAPVIAYLFVSGIIRFCVFKYLWHRYIKHEPPAKPAKYGEDPNYPEESI